MSYKKPLGDPNVLQRRIVANPRYESVEATVDNGITVNLARQLKETEVSIKQGRDELFRRVRPSTVVNYIEWKQAQERIAQMQNIASRGGGIGGGAYAYDYDDEAVMAQRQQQLQQQANFQGFPVEDFMVPTAPKKEMLILDVRDREDYEFCHIQGALHYPASKLGHAMNPFTAEILAFRNKENKVIVLYDLEEEVVVGRKVANIFFEKGCDNVVIISGGLREFVQSHSAYIVGESPVPIVQRAPPRVARAREELSERMSASTRSTLAHSTATSHKPKSLASSLARRTPSANAWR